MNIQIFGIKKCFDTKKAERWFKERRIRYQLIDLDQKGLSKGELQSVKAAVGLNSLFNTGGKDYLRLNLDKISSSIVREELLLNNPGLYRTPIVRNGKQATVGYVPEVWELWVSNEP
ncbi:MULTISPECIES: arsenate reductase family protein [unclassified Dehalobacter]|uniref:arsenate reductase family protein n=1 Tax=unclassified Dehalobacter TaxID=2635733 RepID=UPI00036CA80D|nr:MULTISPECIES: arsenate reductase family protein [unclassified Dehalobacter]RJE49019.1 ArsC family transcriptional regulator [Dehalobacter sp. MCB1]TCX51759.1 ArsC family transcriptional regulator [Dehalobacter sp. 14DCB1]TCX52819.1 ArsC family transcriptional regulator [Dehalobacter sp. 12DCB1]